MAAAAWQQGQVPVELRAAQWEDRQGVLDLIRGAEFVAGVPDHVLERLFTYHWLNPKPNFGYLLAAEEHIVGFSGAIYARRKIAGRTVDICGPSTLYVHPAYRTRGAANPGRIPYARLMVEATVAQKGWTFTVLSPSGPAAAILHSLGFRCVSEARWVFVPDWTTVLPALRGGHVHFDPDRVLPALPEDQRAMACDHLLYGCRCYAIECEGEHSLVITKRTYIPRPAVLGSVPLARAGRGHLPASYLLFLGNREAARARWRELVTRVLLAERTAALVVSDWMAPVPAAGARTVARHVDMLGTGIEASNIDGAYSEMALF